MRAAFSHYVKRVTQKIRKDVAFFVKAKSLWAVAIVTAHILILRHFLYSLCPLVLAVGFPCPGCGMTRAVTLLLAGRFAQAWRMHPFAYVLGGFAAAVAVWRYLLLQDSLRWAKKCLIAVLFSMLLFYAYRMARYFPDEAPMTYYPYHLFYRLRALFTFG